MFVPFSSLFIAWFYLTSVIALYQTCQTKKNQLGICTSIRECWQSRKKEFRHFYQWGACGKWYHFKICCPIRPLQGCGQRMVSSGMSERQKRFQLDNPFVIRSYPSILESYSDGLEQLIGPRINNGNEPPIGFWPWVASLGSAEDNGRINWYCGATLITYSHLLTAAHCVCNGNRPDIIRLRGHDMFYKERSMPRDIKVKKINCHQLYKPNHLYNDIAIIELESPQPVNLLNIKPICLPTGQLNDSLGQGIPSQKVSVAGWGQTTLGGNGSHVLQQVNLTIITHEYCNTVHMDVESRRNFPLGITDELLCAQDLVSKGNSCKGDSGGPVIYADPKTGHYTQIGITSSGHGCGLVGGVAINTRVAKYLSWIYENIGLI